jgi:hypothetical protein
MTEETDMTLLPGVLEMASDSTPTMAAAHRLVRQSRKKCRELRELLNTIAPNGNWEEVVAQTLTPRQILFLRLRSEGLLIQEISARTNLNPCYVGQSIKRAILRLSLPRPWPPRPRFNMPRKMSKADRIREMREGAILARDLETAFARKRGFRWSRKLAPFFRAALGLPPREAFVLDGLRYGWTLDQLGKEMGVTRERARQIAARGYVCLKGRFVPQKLGIGRAETAEETAQ